MHASGRSWRRLWCRRCGTALVGDNHGLTRIFKACLDSAQEHVNGCYVCPFHVCRRRYSKNVVLSTKAKVGVSTCLKVMFGYANGDRMDCITQDAHITKNTTTKFVQRLEAMVHALLHRKTSLPGQKHAG